MAIIFSAHKNNVTNLVGSNGIGENSDSLYWKNGDCSIRVFMHDWLSSLLEYFKGVLN